MQQVEPLSSQLSAHERYACDVAARPFEARDEAGLDRVDADVEDDRDCRSGRFGGEHRRGAGCENHGHLTADQIGRQIRQSIVMALSPTVFDRDVLALDVANLVQGPPESDQAGGDIVGLLRAAAEIANHRHRLLRARRQRQCGRRAAEPDDELTAFHAEGTGYTPLATSIAIWLAS